MYSKSNHTCRSCHSMAGRDQQFRRPVWWPGDINLPDKYTTYTEFAAYAHKNYLSKQTLIGKKLDNRIKEETRKQSQLKPTDVLEGNILAARLITTSAAVGGGLAVAAGGGAAVFGAEKGAELGLFGGPVGVAVGAVGGALVGFIGYGIYKYATRPEEKEYEVQIDEYTDAPASYVTVSPTNLRQEVFNRNIEHGRRPTEQHALGEDARKWYYFGRLSRYCYINMGQDVDPGDHELEAKCGYDIARRCGANVGEFDFPRA